MPSLYDYSDAYILVKGTISNARAEVDTAAQATDRNKYADNAKILM